MRNEIATELLAIVSTGYHDPHMFGYNTTKTANNAYEADLDPEYYINNNPDAAETDCFISFCETDLNIDEERANQMSTKELMAALAQYSYEVPENGKTITEMLDEHQIPMADFIPERIKLMLGKTKLVAQGRKTRFNLQNTARTEVLMEREYLVLHNAIEGYLKELNKA